MTSRLFTDADVDLLLRLLRLPTVGPLEATPDDPPPELWRAQRVLADAARDSGLRVVHHGPADPAFAARPDVPAPVRAAASTEFLDLQPNLVLRLGPELPRESTVMFNVHLDTVAGMEPVTRDGQYVTGRGATDAKGPAVALLAGIRAAVAADAAVGRDIGVLVQLVSGEEGGAMGTFGTRPLVEAGFVGRLNVFCEPTGLRYLPRSTASMTARISVDGQGAVDDRPGAGHNATVLLGWLAQHLAATVDAAAIGGAFCVAGLHTGQAHNRVYGSGSLLLNLSYPTSAAGRLGERLVADAVAGGLAAFTEKFGGSKEFGHTAAEASAITTLNWLKRGLPSLSARDPWAESLLADAGVDRWPAEEPAFTCDAIWMDRMPGTFTAVLGPGSLEKNNAHADGEFAELAELDAFAGAVARILTTFAGKDLG